MSTSEVIENLLSVRRPEQAEQVALSFLSGAPDDPEIQCLLARALYEQHKVDSAFATVKQAIGRHPEYDYAYAIYAHFLHAQGERFGALKYIDEALSLNPNRAEYFGVKSTILLSFGRFRAKEALSVAIMGLEIDPQNLMCTRAMTRALMVMGRKQEARECALSLLALDPESSAAHQLNAAASQDTGRRTDAEQHYLEALRIDPLAVGARYGLLDVWRSKHPVMRWFSVFYLHEYAARFVLVPVLVWLIWIGINPMPHLDQLGPLAAGFARAGLWMFIVSGFAICAAPDEFFNLVMKQDPHYRRILSDDEVNAAHAIGAVVAWTFLMTILSQVESLQACWVWGFATVLLLLPVRTVFEVPPGIMRKTLMVALRLVVVAPVVMIVFLHFCPAANQVSPTMLPALNAIAAAVVFTCGSLALVGPLIITYLGTICTIDWERKLWIVAERFGRRQVRYD